MKTRAVSMYNVFVRNWWWVNAWGGLEPEHHARKYHLARGVTETEARKLCAEYQATHKPGRLSRKAEYERA